jgi:hypothetical protein
MRNLFAMFMVIVITLFSTQDVFASTIIDPDHNENRITHLAATQKGDHTEVVIDYLPLNTRFICLAFGDTTVCDVHIPNVNAPAGATLLLTAYSSDNCITAEASTVVMYGVVLPDVRVRK